MVKRITTMVGDRGATRVLALMISMMCLLCLADCLQDRYTLDKAKETLKILQQKAKAAKGRLESVQNMGLEIVEATQRYCNDLQAIMERGPPEMKKVLPMFKAVNSLIGSAKEFMVEQDDRFPDIRMQKLQKAMMRLIKVVEDFQDEYGFDDDDGFADLRMQMFQKSVKQTLNLMKKFQDEL